MSAVRRDILTNQKSVMRINNENVSLMDTRQLKLLIIDKTKTVFLVSAVAAVAAASAHPSASSKGYLIWRRVISVCLTWFEEQKSVKKLVDSNCIGENKKRLMDYKT